MIEKYLGNKTFWKDVLRIGVPIALQNLLTSSFVLVDTIMVGQLGDISLSAVGMAGQWGWLLNIVLFGFCSGASVFIGQYWGVKNYAGIHRVLGIAFSSVCMVAAVFFAAGFFLPKTVITVFNQDPRVIEIGQAYLKIACFSYPAVALSNVFGSVLRSTENVKLPMFVALVSTVLNAILNYALIFGKFGFPNLGIEGAAIATCISSWAGAVFLYAVSFMKKNILIAPFREIFCATKSDLVEYFKKAFPVILNESSWGLGTLCFNIIFANLGYENFAAVTILRTFENIAFVFFIGLCNACCVIVAKSVGAGEIQHAKTDARRFAFVVPIFSVFIGSLMIIFREQLVNVFNLNSTISQSTLDTAMWITLVYGAELCVRNIPYIQIVGIFRPGGDTVTGVKLDTLCLWGIALPVTLITAFVLKLPFVAVFALMYVAEDYLKSFLCIRHFMSNKWIKPVTDEGKAGLKLFLQQK